MCLLKAQCKYLQCSVEKVCQFLFNRFYGFFQISHAHLSDIWHFSYLQNWCASHS